MKIKIAVLFMVLVAAVVAWDINALKTRKKKNLGFIMKETPKLSGEALMNLLMNQTEFSGRTLLNLLVKQVPKPSDEPLLNLLVNHEMRKKLYTAKKLRSKRHLRFEQVSNVWTMTMTAE